MVTRVINKFTHSYAIVSVLVLSGWLYSCLPGPATRPPSTSTGTSSTQPTRDDNLALGNPSRASTSDPDNYLMVKPGYVLSYNRSRGIANWVSWHLSEAWKGSGTRSNDFRADPAMPSGWYAAKTSDYTNTGFDRGHLCPSDDRDGSQEDNSLTFLMTNIVPQAPRHNREVWKNLEDYTRTLLTGNNEVYVMAGTLGTGGTGANGPQTAIANGKITVPASLWKIIVVLPTGSDDAQRVSTNTRIIAVNIPNTQTAADKPWRSYLVSVDELERLTTYDFLANVPVEVQRVIEARVDGSI
ncbi:DNA/RNA non-specific endonuclease [Nibrella viscosa]|uniref:DNA/RNA non-specific endonuclease n=1 Tax=Nibrella viscosa TaxID=1084524 RepID=A0ABP8KAW2_9BACT